MSPIPLWELTLEDLCLATRAHNALKLWRNVSKAWHAAVLCDACLLHTRNFGRISLKETREALADFGFPSPEHKCGPSSRDYEASMSFGNFSLHSLCVQRLRICQDLCEPGSQP